MTDENLEKTEDNLLFSKQLNQLSEILLGYNEGSLSECITAANKLVLISKKYQQNDQVELLFMQIHSLHETMLDIEADA